MSAMASQITVVSIVYSTVCSGAHQGKHQSPMSLAFVRGIHRWPVNSTRKGLVTRKMFPFHDVIVYKPLYVAMYWGRYKCIYININITMNITFTSTTPCKASKRVYAQIYNEDRYIWVIWYLTRWGRGTLICTSKSTITGSDKGLSPGRREAIKPMMEYY